jgi:hypothetical protein
MENYSISLQMNARHSNKRSAMSRAAFAAALLIVFGLDVAAHAVKLGRASRLQAGGEQQANGSCNED